jgi:hypothetical protein
MRRRDLRLSRPAAVAVALAACWTANGRADESAPDIPVGRVTVHERHGRRLTVFVDGVECGTTDSSPWAGVLEAGAHTAFGKSATETTVVEHFIVKPGATTAVEFTARARADVLAAAGPVETSRPPASPQSAGSAIATSNAGPGGYGGFEAQGLFEPSGTHNDICSRTGSSITKCSTMAPVGGGLVAYAGYLAGPVGIDGMAGVQVDGASVSGTVSGTSVVLTIPRIGGIFAARGRVSWAEGPFEASLALGVGAAVRHVIFVALSAASKTYSAPGVVLDGAFHVQFVPKSSLSLGIFFWAENAGSSVLLRVSPLPEAVHVVQSTQFFALPYVGVEFGP